jgi:WD40 repeat protein
LLSTSLVQAGGRRCACDDVLNQLDPKQVPADLRPDVSFPEIVAAFDVGDRPITALEFLGFAGDTLAVAEFGPARRGAGGPGRFLLYDLAGKAPRQRGALEASGDFVVGLDAGPRNGELLVTGGGRWDQTVKLWRLAGETWAEAKSMPKVSDGWWPRALAFSPDQRLLATASGDSSGPVQLWNVGEGGKTLEPARVLPGPAWGVSALAFSPSGQFLAAGLGSGHRHPSDGQLLVWDLSDSPPKLVHQGTGLDEKNAKEPRDITSLAFLDRGNLLVSGDQYGMLRAWRVTKAGALEPAAKIEAHQRGVRSLVAGPGGEVLSTGNDGCLVFWKPGEKELRRVPLGEGGAVLAAAPSGRHFAIGLTSGVVYVIRLPNEEERAATPKADTP